MAKTKNTKPKTQRRTTKTRRTKSERRTKEVPVVAKARKSVRRKVQRRRQIDPTTCERDYTADEIEFMHAFEAYKRSSGRMFPTCSEILEVVRGLGYERVVPPIAEPSAEADVSADTVIHGSTNAPAAVAASVDSEMPSLGVEETIE